MGVNSGFCTYKSAFPPMSQKRQPSAGGALYPVYIYDDHREAMFSKNAERLSKP